jgi:uncharacterized protein YqgV (UPF0045/DUF77 family)
VIVEIQVLPTPSGNAESRYAHVDAAIAVIQASGLPYEVGPLGTWLEGEPDEVWPVVRAAHEATMAAGAGSVVTVLKVAQGDPSHGVTAAQLIAKHR